MARKYTILVIATMMTIMMVISAKAADWPRWRGPRGDGVSTETGWSPQALSGSPDLLWQVKMGMGHSSVSVQGDYVYSMGSQTVIADGDTTFTDIIFCLDANTGKEIWQYPYPAQERGWPGPGSTPTIDGDAVYTIGRDGDLYCFDAYNGRVRWKRNLVAEEISQTPGWGFCASPIIEGEYVILNAGQSGAVLQKQTGELVWKSEPGTANLPSPILIEQGKNRYTAILGERDFVARDISKGEIIWSEPWPSTDNDPIVFDNKILLTGYRQCKMLEIQGKEVRTLWEKNRLRAEAWLNFVVVGDHAYGFCRVRR